MGVSIEELGGGTIEGWDAEKSTKPIRTCTALNSLRHLCEEYPCTLYHKVYGMPALYCSRNINCIALFCSVFISVENL